MFVLVENLCCSVGKRIAAIYSWRIPGKKSVKIEEMGEVEHDMNQNVTLATSSPL
jgi:hypothetical protein